MPFSFIQASYRNLLRKGGWDALIRFVPKGSGEEQKALHVHRSGIVN